ncbi:hypothetical protein FXF53_21000 [Micromonospora sp. WP24]|uniref:hypothetical protein n=1 Tax=Micromonospora sp. WP24 TaxID=2604469 RepID=UPI0011DAFE35|nr:hypothetical protein [Micromonospora sp. WP24]TYB96888.1 hypothetical protein FXF53_21000 [Micromonospora sp. WP24]
MDEMAKYCVIPGINGSPDSEYIMGTYPNAEAECMNSGGRVVERDEGCGTTTAAGLPTEGGSSVSSPMSAAIVGPIRMLRDRLPESDVLHDLEIVNYAPDMLRMLNDDAAVGGRARDTVGMVSQFALLALVDPRAETLQRSHYTEELHRWLVEFADMVLERTEDEELRDAVYRLVRAFEERVGVPIGALVDELSAGDSPTAS